MEHPARQLQGEIDQILNLLNEGSFFSFTAEERRSLHGEAGKLSQKLGAIEGRFLTLGLLGGTGVGKSTLMNALAGSEIASASHRRPHTDQVLIYRHVEAHPLPVLALSDVPWREITHRGHDILQILLCDLPDFDSLMGEHREHVLHFLKHLDVLVWVTSPEKYGDGRFYEFLRLVPRAKQNFYFVLNKVDLLFEGKTLETGYGQMAGVSSRFQEHLKENGISEPVFYLLAAEPALHSDQPAPWNQFSAFKHQVFQQRDIKQITAIKTANLDVEVQHLFSTFKKEALNLESFARIIGDSVKELEEQRSLWIQGGQEAINLWIGKHIRQDVLSDQGDPHHLVGPGNGLAILLQDFRKRFTKEENRRPDLSLFAPPEEINVSFRRRLEWVEDQIDHRILRQDLAPPFREKLHEILDVTKRFEDLRERFFHLAALHAAEPSLPSFWGFRALQYLLYLLLLAFFLLAIGGETAWREILTDPGGAGMLGLLLSGIYTLFSGKGLAALASYVLLNLLLAFRFYRRYKKLLRHATQKIVKPLRLELVKVWEEELDAIQDGLKRFRTDIQSQIAAVSDLKQGRKRS